MRITTLDELDALPIGSVILDIDGDAWQKRVGGWLIAAYNPGVPFKAHCLPVDLLFVPGRDLVQEAQADAWDEGHEVRWHDVHYDGGQETTRNPYRNEAP